jgi:hypothetical protein
MDSFLMYIKKTLSNQSLKNRMQDLLHTYNGTEFSQYQPYIISLKSKEILEYLNTKKSSVKEKIDDWHEYNISLLKVSQECYDRFNPRMIYSFNDEIHLVFYNTSDYPDLYNGNVTKTLTTISSFVTRQFIKEFTKRNLDFDFTIHAKYAEFNKEFEALNYLVWRQLDCKRNNIITLFKYFQEDVKYLVLDDVTQSLFHNLTDLDLNYDHLKFLINGNILKKELVYIDSDDTMLTRKELNISHELLHENFRENLRKYIYNVHL